MISLADKIRRQLKAGKTPKEIAAMFGTSDSYVRVVRQRTARMGYQGLPQRIEPGSSINGSPRTARNICGKRRGNTGDVKLGRLTAMPEALPSSNAMRGLFRDRQNDRP
jgi:hypothetical protein